jgi:hypothetical protein
MSFIKDYFFVCFNSMQIYYIYLDKASLLQLFLFYFVIT